MIPGCFKFTIYIYSSSTCLYRGTCQFFLDYSSIQRTRTVKINIVLTILQRQERKEHKQGWHKLETISIYTILAKLTSATGPLANTSYLF